MKFKQYQKQFDIKAAGVEVTPEILAKINIYTLKPMTPDEVYVRKYLMAHNSVDRDNERFPEALLDDFARTLSGKSFLIGHNRSGPGVGLFFDASTEDLTPEQFKSITGEDARLPEGVDKVKIVWGWTYLVKAAFNEMMIANIDAGIYRHASIGFKASDIKPVKGQYDNILYWEYVPPGEALEGSIVWLGAQPGATAQKKAGGSEEDIDIDNPKTKGGKKMDWKQLVAMLKRIFQGKSFSEDNLETEVKEALDAYAKSAVEAAVKPLNDKIVLLEPLEAKVKELEPLAADGKAYRESMVADYVTMKAKLGDVSEKKEDQDELKTVASAYPMKFLKAEVETLRKRVEEKFPDSQIKSDDPNNKRGPGGEKNALVPEEK